jgi:hypothetical protein
MGARLVYQEGDGETPMAGSNETFAMRVVDRPAARSGTIVSATATTVVLEPAASATNGSYDGYAFNTGSQAPMIISYIGATRTATVSPAFSPTPSPTDAYAMVSARRVAAQNTGDAAITFQFDLLPAGETNGSPYLRSALDPNTLSPPYNVVATLGAAGDGGVYGAAASYDWRVVATQTGGKVTTGSVVVTVTVDVTTKRVTLTWSKIFGTGYKGYRKLTSASWGANDLRFTLGSPDTLTFIDDGTAGSSGALPVVNTTGGAAPTFGPAPTLSAGPLVVGALQPGQQQMLWLDWVFPSGVPSSLVGCGLTVNRS